MEMIILGTKQRLVQLCHLFSYLDSVGLSIMYKINTCSLFIPVWSIYGHLLYFGTARAYLKPLDAFLRISGFQCLS